MTIKTSSVESKRWYRLGKVLLLLLPLAILIFLSIKGRIHYPSITQKNLQTVFEKNVRYLVGAIVGYGVYALILLGISRLFFYIGFGGIENDTLPIPGKKMKEIGMIKKSSLEKKLLYRIAKAFFLTLPILAAIILFTKGYITIPAMTLKTFGSVVQKNSLYIVGGVVGVMLYYLALNVFRRMITYVGFGGIQDDTLPKPMKLKGRAARYAVGYTQPVVQPQQQDNSGRGLLLLLILIIWIASYSATPQYSVTIPGTPVKKTTCIPTGCGTNRRSSCTNQCYSSNSDCRQASQRCSSYTCRQCPY